MKWIVQVGVTLVLLALTCGEVLADPVQITQWIDADTDGIPMQVDPDDQVFTDFPSLGTVSLDLGGPFDITAGEDLVVSFTLSDAVTSDSTGVAFALGDLFTWSWSHDYEFGDSGGASEQGGSAEIPAGFFTDAGWDLNTAGTYTLYAQLFSGGTVSPVVSTTVTVSPVVPEPGTLALFGLGASGLVLLRRRRARASR